MFRESIHFELNILKFKQGYSSIDREIIPCRWKRVVLRVIIPFFIFLVLTLTFPFFFQVSVPINFEYETMLQRNKLVSIGEGVGKKKEKKVSIDFTKSQLRIGEDKENYWNRSNSSPTPWITRHVSIPLL